MQHRRRGDLAHHLAARAVILGNAERFAQLRFVKPAQACGDCRHAERIPGARGVIVAHRCMQGDAGPAGDFVADDQGRQRFRSGQVGPGLRQRGKRRHHSDTDMALGGAVAIVAVEVVDLRGNGIGRAGNTGAASVEQHAGRVLRVGGTIEQDGGIAGDAPCLHRPGGDGDTERIEQKVSRLLQHRLGEDGSGTPQHEIGKARGGIGTDDRPLTPV